MIKIKDIRELDKEALVDLIEQMGHKKFRAKQVWHWLWTQRATSWDQMLNVPKDLRQQLAQQYEISSLVISHSQKSSDGTLKFQLTLSDNQLIEAVLIPVTDDKRYTLCVSSQVGCSLSCKFCATGTMGLSRNLRAYEIVQQYWMVDEACRVHYGHGITNIVYMGMGEPLLNYAQVVQSIRLLTDETVAGLSPRRFTVSTAGIAKMIIKLADEGLKVNLALSLHAADDTKRNSIMEINQSNNLEVLMDALHYYYRQLYTKVSYEYIALRDFNDQLEDADKLVSLTFRFPVMVNIIEYNPVSAFAWKATKEDQLDRFAKRLRDQGVMVTVRRSRGKDIDAACGQLALKGNES